MRIKVAICSIVLAFIASTVELSVLAQEPTKEQCLMMLPMLDKQLQKNPNDWMALAQRATVRQVLGDYKAAISDFTSAMNVNPSEKFRLLTSRANTYARMNDHKNAIADADAAIAMSPTAIGYANRGTMYLRMNKINEATRDYSTAVKLSPRFGVAWEGLGEVAYRLRQYEKAVEYFNAAIRFDSSLADAFHFRGKALQALGKTEQGKRDLDRAASTGYHEDDLRTKYADK